MSGGRTPLELLAPRERELPFLHQVWGPAVGGVIGFLCVCATHFGTRRPVFSGIQNHVIGVATFAGIGKWLEDNREIHYAERDAVLRHYIELHTEDFPVPERKKWADVIRPWVPIR